MSIKFTLTSEQLKHLFKREKRLNAHIIDHMTSDQLLMMLIDSNFPRGWKLLEFASSELRRNEVFFKICFAKKW